MSARAGDVEPSAAGDTGAIPCFDAIAQEYVASYGADSLGGYVLRAAGRTAKLE